MSVRLPPPSDTPSEPRHPTWTSSWVGRTGIRVTGLVHMFVGVPLTLYIGLSRQTVFSLCQNFSWVTTDAVRGNEERPSTSIGHDSPKSVTPVKESDSRERNHSVPSGEVDVGKDLPEVKRRTSPSLLSNSRTVGVWV